VTWIEAIAVVFGFLCVVLTIRQNVWCWPTGLVQVGLYIFVFWSAKLYSDMILHVIYVGLQFYGWHHWLHGGRDHGPLVVSRLPVQARAMWLVVLCVTFIAWGFVMDQHTDAAAPYPDAFIAAASLVAQWLMTRKRLESWWLWISVDAVAIAVYLYKGLYLTTVLYAVFLGLAITGLTAWRDSMSEQQT
jgi:nicotinamide mononucleotide transporter